MNEKEQFELVSDFVEEAILPVILGAETMLAKIDPDFVACPYFDTFITLSRILVCKGWTAAELLKDVAHHAEAQEEENRNNEIMSLTTNEGKMQ